MIDRGAEPIDRDRRVHARYDDTCVVRYDRQGKWYVEYDPPRMRPARHVTVRQAVDEAIRLGDMGGTIFLGLPGGGSFDRGVRANEQ